MRLGFDKEPINMSSFDPQKAAPAIDPIAMARKDLQKSLPRRFWDQVTLQETQNGFAILLDGRPTRTPSRKEFVLANRVVAEAVAEEWREVGEYLDPAQMPLTRIVNSALDAVSERMDDVALDLANYASSDLLCYRAAHPEALVARQNLHWNPVLDWARDTYGWRFQLAEGVIHIAQAEETLQSVKTHALALKEPVTLAALHVVTTLTGSALLAMALKDGAFGPTAIWNAAHVDEDVQMEIWGHDEEAMARRAIREAEFKAAATLLAAI